MSQYPVLWRLLGTLLEYLCTDAGACEQTRHKWGEHSLKIVLCVLFKWALKWQNLCNKVHDVVQCAFMGHYLCEIEIISLHCARIMCVIAYIPMMAQC